MAAATVPNLDEIGLSEVLMQTVVQGELDVENLRADTIDTCTGIDYITQPISYETFFLNYLLPNKPCIFGPWATQHWGSRNFWSTEDSKPNLQYLKEKYGDAICPVANCNQVQYSAHTKKEMSLSEFVEYMDSYRAEGYPQDEDCLYLKDWHFQKQYPAAAAYTVPCYFQSDWMNEFWDERVDTEDDYRFVYIGPKGSWTPFHADVFRSFSWSANICGCKKWIILPPGEEEYLKDKFGHLPFDLNSPELNDVSKYPDTAKLTRKFEVYQRTGEIFFVPSGWHHQVLNMEDTISINHNWSNACNMDLFWHHLVTSLVAVQREIDDCHDMDAWPEQCQMILRADTGMDYADFFTFIHTISTHRIEALQKHKVTTAIKSPVQDSLHDDPNYKQNDSVLVKNPDLHNTESGLLNHYLYDLIQIKELVVKLVNNNEFLQLDLDKFKVKPKELILQIENIVIVYSDY